MADTVKTVKSSGGDYSSLSAWEAGQQKVISAGNTEQAECYNFVDSTPVSINGWTTAANAYIRIYTPASERHNGTPGTGYRLHAVANYAPLISVGEEFVRIEGVNFKHLSTLANTSSNDSTVQVLIGASSDVRVEACLLEGGPRIGISCEGYTAKVGNTIVLGHPIGMRSQYSLGVPISRWHNCTVANCDTAYSSDGTGTVSLKNCYAHATTTEYTGTMTRGTCAHASATVYSGSTASTAYSTANFVSVTAGSENLHLTAASALRDIGTDLSADANYPTTVDIDGQTRGGSWDIGADEYVSGGTPVSASRSVTYEALGPATTTRAFVIESLAQAVGARAPTFEALADARQARAISFEALGQTAVAATAVLSVEALAAVLAGRSVAIESIQAARTTAVLQLESLQWVGADRSGTIEALGRIDVARSIGLEALGALAGTASLSHEALAQLARTAGIPFEALLGAEVVTVVNVVERTAYFQLRLDASARFALARSQAGRFGITQTRKAKF